MYGSKAIYFLSSLFTFWKSDVIQDSMLPDNCGRTPMYSKPQVYGGYSILPDEFGWLASLQYRNMSSYRMCGGSVINSRHVLTAAHCVSSELYLTGVRLGDFRRKHFCDYGTLNCQYYQNFGISKIIQHKEFGKDMHTLYLHNDIALIRLDRNIIFEGALQPICLPFNSPELNVNTPLIVCGWGETKTKHDSKQAVEILLHDKNHCENQHSTMMCAGNIGKHTCQGDSGGPLMHQFERNRMVLEGIVSQGYFCGHKFDQVSFTNVRKFLNWIKENIKID